jgi:hypothetical protein
VCTLILFFRQEIFGQQLPSLLSCIEYHAVPAGQRVFACSSGEKACQSTRYIPQQ